MIRQAIGRLLGRPEFAPPLEASAAPRVELGSPEVLHLSLCQTTAEPLPLRVSEGVELDVVDYAIHHYGPPAR